MSMETISNWEAAVLAAGVTTVYNSDDWESGPDAGSVQSRDAGSGEGAAPQH